MYNFNFLSLANCSRSLRIFFLFLFLPAVFACATATEAVELRHTGAVHFYAKPGNLEIQITKSDHSTKRDPEQRRYEIFLFGPDKSVYDKIVLKPNKQEDKQQIGKLKAKVKFAGVYTMLITAPFDRHQQNSTLTVTSNAEQFLYNSGTSHTDVKREEPIALAGEIDKPTSIIFQPRKNKKFGIELRKLPANDRALEVFDAKENLIKTIPLKREEMKIDFDAEEGDREGLWELRFPTQKGEILIDGLNHNWINGEQVLPIWSTSRESYFDYENYVWLLEPSRYARNIKPGDSGNISFTLFNNSSQPLSLQVGTVGAISGISTKLSVEKLQLKRGETKEIQLSYEVQSEIQSGNYQLHLIAYNPVTKKQSFSLIEFRVDSKDPDMSVDLPMNLELHGSQFQYAYDPGFSRHGELYFDADNRPWMVDNSGLHTLKKGNWETVEFPGHGDLPRGTSYYTVPDTTLGSDRQGYIYAIVRTKGKYFLMRAKSDEKIAQIAPLPAGGNYRIEAYTGGWRSQLPPAIYRTRSAGEEKIAFWSRRNYLELLVPELVDGKLSVSDPIPVSNQCIGFSTHSGAPRSVASQGDQIHLLWGVVSDPAGDDPGVPNYLATYTRSTKSLSEPQLIGYGPPVNDGHNTSMILVDAQGGRHIIIGTHGRPFQYTHAAPGSDTWSEPKKISEEQQTYIGAAFDRSGSLHVFFRLWERAPKFSNQLKAALYHQQMSPAGEWSEPAPFARVPLSAYGVFRQKTTVDREGRVYLSFLYWATWTNYREVYRRGNANLSKGESRFVLSNTDGEKWKLVTQEDLQNRIYKPK